MKPSAEPASIDAYIAACPADAAAILAKIRATIAKTAPKATEKISYRMPAFFQDGVLVYYAAFKSHVGIFPPVRGDADLERDLAPFRGPKGNLKFPLEVPFPYPLLRRIVKARLAELEEKALLKRAKKKR